MKSRNCAMKIKFIICGIISLVIIIFFFPITTVRTLSGNGEILSKNKEKIGDCELSIEIIEVNARTFCYNKQFSFVLDGSTFPESIAESHFQTLDDFFVIWQSYYDAEKNAIASCYLVCQNDLSFAIVGWNNKFYFIDNGANIPYSELPVS